MGTGERPGRALVAAPLLGFFMPSGSTVGSGARLLCRAAILGRSFGSIAFPCVVILLWYLFEVVGIS